MTGAPKNWFYNPFELMQEMNMVHDAEFEVLENEPPTFREVLLSLFYSRKVLLALAGVISTVAAHYFNIPVEVWAAIDALLLAVIGGIAYEDGAEKSAG